jgi:hypothetical protein
MRSSPGVPEGVLDVSRGQPPRVHLCDEALSDLGVALEEAHEARAKRLVGSADLGDRDGNGSLGRADPAGLVAVPRAPLALSSSLVAAPATEEVGLSASSSCWTTRRIASSTNAETTLASASAPPQ